MKKANGGLFCAKKDVFAPNTFLFESHFMLKNDEFESDKVEMYQSNFKAGVYAWLFLVALYIFLYILTYY